MSHSPQPIVRVDLSRVQHNAREIAKRVGVPVYAMVKADAYGLGIRAVVPAIKDLVAGFCVFSLAEAAADRLWELGGKPILAIGPADAANPADYLVQHVKPAVADAGQAEQLRAAGPVLCVDTGMQRFACPAEKVAAALAAGDIHEAFTHAVTTRQVERFLEVLGQRKLLRHAAGSSMLDQPSAWLDAVRPGLALYTGAVSVSAPLLEARTTHPPAGYSGFSAARHGVILCGYNNGLRTGPCIINGQPRRVLEVGMQSSYVEIGKDDRVGDAVLLLGEGLSEAAVAAAWKCSPQNVLTQLCRAGRREYAS